MNQTLGIALTATVLVYILVTVIKVSFYNTRVEKLMADGQEAGDPAVERSLALFDRRERNGISLQTTYVILLLLIAGLIVLLVQSAGFETSRIGLSILLILVSGLVLAGIEQIIEHRVQEDPEKWTVRLSGLTRVWLAIFSPVMVLPMAIFRLFSKTTHNYYRVTEEELNILLDAGQREGVIEVDEREMINSIFEFRDTLVREIMIPRIDLLTLSVDNSILEAIDSMLESGYSRVPVYEENVDDVRGVLYIKDLLSVYRDGKSDESIRAHLRPAYFVPETKKLGSLLTEMRNERNHIAVVVDEYGGVAGIATLEDIVEEIVGEIQDETDAAEEALSQQLSDGEFIFLGKIDINDFNQIMGTDLSKAEADTLGGVLYNRFGGVPKTGETVRTGDILMTVEQVTGKRIHKVRVSRTGKPGDAQTQNAHVEP